MAQQVTGGRVRVSWGIPDAVPSVELLPLRKDLGVVCLFICLYSPPGSSHVPRVSSANVSRCWELIYFHFSEDLGHGFVSGF